MLNILVYRLERNLERITRYAIFLFFGILSMLIWAFHPPYSPIFFHMNFYNSFMMINIHMLLRDFQTFYLCLASSEKKPTLRHFPYRLSFLKNNSYHTDSAIKKRLKRYGGILLPLVCKVFFFQILRHASLIC